jgi:hypothetical protein
MKGASSFARLRFICTGLFVEPTVWPYHAPQVGIVAGRQQLELGKWWTNTTPTAKARSASSCGMQSGDAGRADGAIMN